MRHTVKIDRQRITMYLVDISSNAIDIENLFRDYVDDEDLEVYKTLCKLHLDVSELTLKFPQF